MFPHMDCSVFWAEGAVISEDRLFPLHCMDWELAAVTHYSNKTVFPAVLGSGSDIHATCPPSGGAHLISVNTHFECFFSCREATYQPTTQWGAGLL